MEKAGEVLKKILDKDSVIKAKYYNALFSSWDEIVLEPLAAHSRVLDIEQNQLLISVDHPGWMQLFYFNEHKILKKIQNRFPELAISIIKVRVELMTSSIYKPVNTKKDAPEEELKGLTHMEHEPHFGNIKDEELRNLLLNLYIKVIDKEKKDD